MNRWTRWARRVRRVYLGAVAASLAGCSVAHTGLVEVEDRVRLRLREGGTRTLSARGPAAPLAHLDGFIVAIEGQHGLGPVDVASWRVIESPSGSAPFVGTVRFEERGTWIELRNGEGGVGIDETAAEALEPHRGQLVVVDGVVEGAQRIRVLYYRVLTDPGGEAWLGRDPG